MKRHRHHDRIAAVNDRARRPSPRTGAAAGLEQQPPLAGAGAGNREGTAGLGVPPAPSTGRDSGAARSSSGADSGESREHHVREFLRRLGRRTGRPAGQELAPRRPAREIAIADNYGRGLSSNRRPKEEIGRSTVEDLLEADGTATFEDLYATERAAAA